MPGWRNKFSSGRRTAKILSAIKAKNAWVAKLVDALP